MLGGPHVNGNAWSSRAAAWYCRVMPRVSIGLPVYNGEDYVGSSWSRCSYRLSLTSSW